MSAPPTAAFSFLPASPIFGEVVNFTDESVPVTGGLVAWAWDFGDGNISAVQNPTHIFALPGTYNVSLIVADGAHSSSPHIEEVIVGVAPDGPPLVPPIADFGCNHQSGEAPLAIDFVNLSSGVISGYAWSFG